MLSSVHGGEVSNSNVLFWYRLDKITMVYCNLHCTYNRRSIMQVANLI